MGGAVDSLATARRWRQRLLGETPHDGKAAARSATECRAYAHLCTRLAQDSPEAAPAVEWTDTQGDHPLLEKVRIR